MKVIVIFIPILLTSLASWGSICKSYLSTGEMTLTSWERDIQVTAIVGKPKENKGGISGYIRSYLERDISVNLSDDFTKNLSAYSINRDPTVFNELQEIVPAGFEIRIYFKSEKYNFTYRLVIRRDPDGNRWALATNVFDGNQIDENYYNSASRSNYTINEKMFLETEVFNQTVNNHHNDNGISRLYHIMMEVILKQSFEESLAVWKKSIPENYLQRNVLKLFMYDHGLRFTFEGGLSSFQQQISDEEQKILSAIKYLIANQLVFHSSNAMASGISAGIYSQTDRQPRIISLAGYDFNSELLKAMDKAGILYVNGEWVKWFIDL